MKKSCPKCSASENRIVKYGFFKRRSDSKSIQRFKCLDCKNHFSGATFSKNYRQRKRRLNFQIFKDYGSNVSQRRMALKLNTTRNTIARKIKIVALQCKDFSEAWLEGQIFNELQFDDLETIEHTKYKPVSIPVVVTKKREILGFEVARIPAKGHLAKFSRKKYGFRPNEAPRARERLLAKLTPNISQSASFECDEHPHYPEVIAKYYPAAELLRYKSKRSAIIAGGELKNVKFDPLFKVNHTFAMFRANMSRLIRRTWNTTKSLESLEDHMAIYTVFHNCVLLKQTDGDKKKALQRLFHQLAS